MDKQEYNKFEEMYLGRFKKYFKECTNNSQKKELKRSVYDNTNLNTRQKDKFWEKVTK